MTSSMSGFEIARTTVPAELNVTLGRTPALEALVVLALLAMKVVRCCLFIATDHEGEKQANHHESRETQKITEGRGSGKGYLQIWRISFM